MDSNCFNLDQTVTDLAKQWDLNRDSVRAAVDLLEEGNTLPFIARYRKEATRGLDETSLRKIEDGLAAAKELAARKVTILKSIDQQNLLTGALRKQIEDCADRKVLEDLYLPFKPKRRTRATIAKERGLGPLALILEEQKPLPMPRKILLGQYIDPSKDVHDGETALAGACDIIAEQWAEQASTRKWLLDYSRTGHVTSKVKRGKKTEDSKFEMYFAHREPVKRVPSHRFLAMKRGEAEGILRVGIEVDDEFALRKFKGQFITNPNFEFKQELLATVEDCYKRLLLPTAESSLLQELKEAADKEAVDVFSTNLRDLLLAPPAGARVTIGIDPGYRTGCKVAVVDETGRFLESAAIYPTPPKNDTAGAGETLMQLIQKHGVELIAIGNGTASRETDGFVGDLIKSKGLKLTKAMVSESGASIYSASEAAVAEFPDLDVTVRGAISIAHRLQDPLAELVKIDPQSIGVGQYQHDVNQTLLRKGLDREVQSCVNSVGVDLNMASPSLLAHVSGIGPKLAERIVDYRDENGEFTDRQQLQSVPKLGKKAFEQAAGFLRIRNGDEPLDNSAVHPESYYVVEKIASKLAVDPRKLVGNESVVAKVNAEDFVDDRVGLLTLVDILDELKRPGRDPRSEFKVARFRDDVNELTDLKIGMILEGIVTNVTKFGAFVDVGVHQDGLVHISELADQYVSDPGEVVSVSDVVKVKVLEVDLQRKRVALSRKQA